jgi:hypothetical protein
MANMSAVATPGTDPGHARALRRRGPRACAYRVSSRSGTASTSTPPPATIGCAGLDADSTSIRCCRGGLCVLLVNGVDWGFAAVLAASAVVISAVGFCIFPSRDLRG